MNNSIFSKEFIGSNSIPPKSGVIRIFIISTLLSVLGLLPGMQTHIWANAFIHGLPGANRLKAAWPEQFYLRPTALCSLTIVCPPINGGFFQCLSDVPPANPAIVNVIDSCGQVIRSVVQSVIGTGCGTDTMTITRTYILNDGLSTETCTQSFKVLDTTPPDITCPFNITIQCTESTATAHTGDATATDGCGGSVTITSYDYQTTPPVSPEMRWTYFPPGATTGNCTSGSDCQAGTVCYLLEYTPGVTGTLTTYTTGFFVDCYNGNNPIVTNTSCVMGDMSGMISDCGGTGLILMNSSGNSGFLPIVKNVPVFLHQVCFQLGAGANILLDEDEATDLSTSVDLAGGGTTSEQPAYTNYFVNFNSVCAQDVCVYPNSIYRQFVATDNCGNQNTCVQQITIEDTTPPVITCPPNITIQCNESTALAHTGNATATDGCGGSVTLTSFDYQTTPPAVPDMRWTYFPPGATSGNCTSGSDCETGTVCYLLEYTPGATGTLNAYTTGFFVDCYNGNSPVVTNESCVMGDMSGEISDCGGTGLILMNSSGNSGSLPIVKNVPVFLHQVCFQLGAGANILLDEDEATDLTTSIDLPGGGTMSEQPAFTNYFVNFNSVCSPDACNFPSALYREFIATDICGNQNTCVQQISIQDTIPPVVSCPANVTLTCTESTAPDATGTATATDNCDTSTVITYADVLITGSCPQKYTINRTWSATDNCNNTGTCIQQIAVDDSQAPSITCPNDITVQCANQVPAPSTIGIIASDNCTGSPVVTFVDDVTIGQTCVNQYTLHRTYRATDECGNSTTCIQVITVFDNTPPTIVCPQDVTVQCANQIPPQNSPSATASDNCSGLPTIMFVSDVTVGQTCSNQYTLNRTYRAIDECGNSATCLQVITVIDNTPPAITCPASVTVQCSADIPPLNTGQVMFSDVCSGTLAVVHVVDLISGQTCFNRYNVVRIYQATDACGNTATCSQSIVVFDNTPPLMTCPPNVTFQCASQLPQPNIADVTATDNCSGGPAVITFVSDVTVGQICINRFTVNRTYRATDICGNSGTCVQVITIFDNTGPSITCPANLTVQCASQVPPPNTAGIPASDNCSGTPVITFVSDVTVGQTCINRYDLNRTYRATDECGNSTTCIQVITVFDNTPPTITCPAPITVQCANQVPPQNSNSVTASDNCSGLPTISFVSDVTVGQTCVNRYTLNRTYRATDECGNSATCLQVITVFDNTVPTITCPAPVTVQCANQVPPQNSNSVTASDNCSGLPTISFVSDVTVGQTCINRYTVNRTYRATDECGNSATCLQVITVFDNTAPTITCPASLTVQCANQVPLQDATSVTATDNCSGLPTISFVSDVTVGQTCTNRYTLNRTYRATDECGNSATCIQVITVFDNTPPAITCPANTTVQCASQVPAPNPAIVVSTDNCSGGAPVVTFVSDVTVGQTCINRYTLNRTYRSTDVCGNSATCVQVITIFDNTVPAMTCPANTTVQCASQVPAPNTAGVTATDNCNGVPVITFVSDVTVGQTCINRYNLNRTYRATDECGNSATCIQVITVFDNTPPSITCPAPVTVQCANQVPPQNANAVTASDNCNGLPTISFVSDVTVGQTCVNRYTLNRTYRATDECGNSATCLQVITVFDNTAPTMTCPPPVTVQCANQVPLQDATSVTATDNCSGLPTISFVSDVTVGQTCVNRYTLNRTYRATDECGNSTTCIQVITIFDNTAPSITCPANVTFQCASQVPAPNPVSVTTSDNCGGAPVVTFVNDVTVGQTCVNNFTLNRTYRATDACGNSATCIQIITVFDNTTPVITCPANVTFQCASQVPAPNPAGVTSSDNCSGVPVVTFVSDVTVNQTCINRYDLDRTYRATDACGNSATCIQVITVFDNTPPSITCPAPVTVQCASQVPNPNIGQVTASDNCNGVPVITFVSDVTVGQTCINRYTLNRTYRATDECGNSATCVQVITVFDNTAPSLTCPANLTVQCASQVPVPSIIGITGTDNCNGVPVISFVSDVTVGQTCINRYTLNRTYRATDECGNSATCVQVISVFDNTNPSITCPANITVQCAGLVPAPSPASVTTSDNCNGVPVVTFVSDVTVGQTCANRYTLNRTYRSTDECGNSATCVQVITVFDSGVPTLTCPANLTVSCASQVPAPNPAGLTTSDNCSAPTVTFVSDITTNQTCANRYTLTRTYRSTDVCGNSATCTQIITVNDQTPPTVSCPGNLSIDIQESTLPAHTGTATATDNCSGAPVVTFSDVTTAGQCSQNYMITRTWLATDVCGNSATCTQLISVMGGCTLDLSLTKTLDPNQGPVEGGDNVNFTITVFNNGELDVSSVSIIDYIPLGFTLNDPDWTPGILGSTGQSASIVLSIGNGGLPPGGLQAGQSVSVQITLQANPDIQSGVYINTAEIDHVLDINGIDVTLNDIDSTPDDNDTNDPPGEDDHSEAIICVLPHPVIVGDDYVCPDELVTYHVADFNPNNTYTWILNGGGMIVSQTDSSVTIQWQHAGGGPFQLSVTETGSQSCQGTSFLAVFVQGVITFACNDNVQVSINEDGIAVISPNMILEGEDPHNNNFYVVITDAHGNVLPSDTVDCSYVGQTLTVSVRNICDQQSCWGTISIEDKIHPQIECACPIGNNDENCQINCIQAQQLANGIIPPELQPVATDNCPNVTVGILHIDENNNGCSGGYIRVTWVASDASGNSATCQQQFNIIPLSLETIVCPANFIGQCGTSTDPSVTGWPTVDGYPLSDEGGVCNIFTGYWDHPLNDCGGGQKIERNWTILDWCTQEIRECIQIIKLQDNEGPVLTCPNDISIGTDFWYCYANFSVPKPEAHDNCSEIVTYDLHSSDGVVVAFGNNFVVNGLELGTHTLTWIVTDECGNSSSCSFHVTVEDNVVPVANCDQHTVVSLTNDGPSGITLVPAEVFNDGSYDNCSPVTFRARRMESCIDIDWTTEGACIDDTPGGVPPVNSRDRGTVHRPCVPFSCCDVGAGPIMVELEVTDAAGNHNYCMVEAIVQDKIAPFVQCPPDIVISCTFWFNIQEGTYVDDEGNGNGNLDEDPLSNLFGNMYDAFRYDESIRQPIVINDPGNHDYFQPHTWGVDGWADDNCEVHLSVRDRLIDDCTGGSLPANAPDGAVKLLERRFTAEGGQAGVAPGVCTQRIWVVDFDPFYISDKTCNNPDPNDGVIWPCDVLLTDCPDDLGNTGQPTILSDACNLIGVTYEDQRFDFVDGACFKILRDWAVIDWCQYNSQTGYGLWHYTQVIKVHDKQPATFVNCPQSPQTLCVADPGVSLPDNNQAFLGEGNPLASSCSVHLNLSQVVYETCSDAVQYDVKLYPFNGDEYIQLQATTSAPVDSTNHATISFDTRNSPIQSIRLNGIPYNSKWCGDYHRILWSVEDGCGNWSTCEYLLRLEDCKQPSPVCINGLSTVVMPIGGQVTVWAKDFNASSYDDCTAAKDLLYSFSGDSYQPSHTFTCENVPAFGVEITQQIWVADGGTDDNCNGQIEWGERNKDYCTTTIVITDNNNVCSGSLGSVLAGQILTTQTKAVEKVNVNLNSPGHVFPVFTTLQNGLFGFNHLQQGLDYTIVPERKDNARNGVSTLDLVQIQKHLLGKELFTSPYQFIAADANNNQQVSAIDLVEIRKVILGINQVFPNNTSWRFVEKGYQMDPNHPWPFQEQILIPGLASDSLMHNDFVAVKVGDVNNSAQASAQDILPRSNRRVVSVMANDEFVKAGEEFTMNLTLPEKLEGFQWTLETEGLDFERVHSDQMDIGDEHVGQPESGVITMSWNGDIQNLKSDGKGIMLQLTWKALESGKLSQMIHMSDRITPVEGYTPAGEIVDVHLKFDTDESDGGFALYQNKPNPWNGYTSIGFDLPADASATLSVYDVTGKEVYRMVSDFKAGVGSSRVDLQACKLEYSIVSPK